MTVHIAWASSDVIYLSNVAIMLAANVDGTEMGLNGKAIDERLVDMNGVNGVNGVDGVNGGKNDVYKGVLLDFLVGSDIPDNSKS